MSYSRVQFQFGGEKSSADIQQISFGNRLGATPVGSKIEVAVQDSDLVLKSGSTMTGNLTFNGGNIVMVGTATVDGRDVSADGAVLDALNRNGTGLVAKTGAGSFARRSLVGTPEQIVITTGDGVAGDPTFRLADNPVIPGTAAMTVPAGPISAAPPNAGPGVLRYCTDNGEFEGWSARSQKLLPLVMTDDPVLFDPHVVWVKSNAEQADGQFASVKAAIESVTDASSSNTYVVQVGAGTFYEEPFTMKPYVSVVGHDDQCTLIFAADPNSDFIRCAPSSAISRCCVCGATGASLIGEPAAAFRYDAGGTSTSGFYIDNVRFGNNNVHVKVISTNADVNTVYINAAKLGGSAQFNVGFYAESSGTGGARILIRDSGTTGMTAPYPTEMMHATGAGSEVTVIATSLKTASATPSGNGIRLADGAITRVLGVSFAGFDKAIWLENDGAGPQINLSSSVMLSNRLDLVIDHPGATGTYDGQAARSRVQIVDGAEVAVNLHDGEVFGTTVTGPFYLGPDFNQSTDVVDLLYQTPTMGLLAGGEISLTGTPTVNIAAGYGYVTENGVLKRIAWPDTAYTLAVPVSNFVYVTAQETFADSAAMPDTVSNILLGRVVTVPDENAAVHIDRTPLLSANHGNRFDKFAREAIGPVFASGCTVSENATTPYMLDVSQGHYFIATNEFTPTARTAISFVEFSHAGGAPKIVQHETIVKNSVIDNGSDLVPMTAGYFAKHMLYVSNDADLQDYPLVIAQAEHPTIDEARNAPLPAPSPTITDATVPIAAIIVQEGASRIAEILDIRPRMGFATPSISSAGVHGSLLGLEKDDHRQYVLVNGFRAMSGPLDMGGFSITNCTTIDAINVVAHATRHTPNGADPLPTAAPTTPLTSTTANTAGTANSFARSDHTHAVTGLQPVSAELNALAGLAATGLVRRTATATYTAGTPVNLATEVTGNLAVTRLNGGSNASAATFWRGDGTWAVTDGVKSVNVAGPSEGVVMSGGPITTTGTINVALANDLAAVEALSGRGVAVRTASDAWSTRTITGTAGGIVVTNGDGVAGDPVVALAYDPAIPGNAGMGLPVGTTTQRAAAPGNGTIRWNSTTARLELYENGGWVNFARTLGDTFTSSMGFNSYIEFGETVIPPTPASNKLRLSATDQGGYTVLDQTDDTGTTMQLFRDTVFVVINTTGFTIPKGAAVSVVGSASGLPSVKLAQADNPATVAHGMAMETIAPGGNGRMLVIGRLKGFDTSGFAVGVPLFLSPTTAGGLVAVRPSPPNFVEFIGVCTKSDASDGELFIYSSTPQGIAAGAITGPSFTIGATAASSMSLLSSSTAQRTFTFPDVSGTVITSNNLPTLSFTGDATGSGTANIQLALTSTGTPGTYSKVTTDAQGRVTSGSNPTTLAGYGISDAQPLDSDLTALANTATLGLYTITGTGSSATRMLAGTLGRITVANPTGQLGNPTIDLAASGATAGTYNTVAVDAYGRVTTGSNTAYLTANQTITLSGDISGSGTTTIATTLPPINANIGVFTALTVNAKGQVTGAANMTASGDASGTASGSSIALTLKNTGTPGTYTKVTTDAQGRVTSGSVPTTLAGYAIADAVNTSQLGAANGVATLDATGKLTTGQIPSSLVGAVVYQGTWNAASNTPTLTSGVGTKGNYYKVAVGGVTSIDGIGQWNAGDTIIFDGTTWDKIDGIANEVLAVFGRTGNVTAQSGDYTATQITNTPAGSIVATSVQAALNELDTKKLAANQPITLSGDATGSGTTAIAVTLANTGVAAGSYSAVTVDAKGRVTSAANLTAGGDVTGTASGTNINLSLTTTGVAAGSYRSVTVNTTGRVTAGTNPTTLAGYAISDAQPLDSDLTALANIATTGLYAITAVGASTTRSLATASTGRITISNADGVAGNPTLDLATVGTGGNFSFCTVDPYGRVVSAGQVSLTGDVGGTVNTATGVIATTLANSGVATGSYTSANVTVDAKGRVTSIASTPIKSSTYYAASFDNPNNANWPSNALAPATADATNNSLTVRSFDDTASEGVGFSATVPSNATSATFRFKGRAATAPTALRGVILQLYSRAIPDNAPVAAWSAATTLATLSITANAYYQYYSQAISLATLALTAGTLYQFELIRYGASASDTLVGDWLMIEMTLEFG